jgi:hypothetical protein
MGNTGFEPTGAPDIPRPLPVGLADSHRGNQPVKDEARPLPVAPPEALGRDSMQTGCKRLAPVAPVAPAPEFPADLRTVAEAWPRLPEAIRAGILAMVKAAERG